MGGEPHYSKSDMTVIPAQSGDVAQVAHLPASVAQAFGINTLFDNVDRRLALSIPAVRRGRQVIAGTLGAAPLVCTRTRAGNAPERVFRQLLSQPDPNLTLSYTLTMTVDDLLFNGVSYWRVLEFGSDKYPSRAERVAPDRIRITEGQIFIDDKPVTDREVIRFDGPDEGILFHGSRALKTYLLLEEAVRNYARLDIPLGVLRDTKGNLTQTEVQELLDAWEVARKKRSTAYIPDGMEYDNPTFNSEQIELGAARGFQAAEIARLMNLPASYINAPTNDSLTYSTTESNRRELVDMTLAPFIIAIEQRLSMPDVTPNGTVVTFDLGKFLRGDIKSVMDTAKVAVEAGLLTVNEVREEWLSLPPLPETKEPTDGNS